MHMGKTALGGIFAALIAMTATATAVPFAGVNNAFWRVQFFGYSDLISPPTSILPSGISIGCFGSAASIANGCQDGASLLVFNGSDAIIKSGGISITNNSGADLPGFLLFKTDFSAFNPGGPSIGAQVDDATYQYAAFSSSVFGLATGDQHACDTRVSPNMGPNACGVFSPDSSQGEFGIGPLAAGQSVTQSYQINIAATVFVPEPLTVSLFGAGLAGAAALRRRRAAK